MASAGAPNRNGSTLNPGVSSSQQILTLPKISAVTPTRDESSSKGNLSFQRNRLNSLIKNQPLNKVGAEIKSSVTSPYGVGQMRQSQSNMSTIIINKNSSNSIIDKPYLNQGNSVSQLNQLNSGLNS